MLKATRELLVEQGYQATTVVAIARRAGVGAPTIYRRWPRREALIEDAAFGGDVEVVIDPGASGDLREDLRAWTSVFIDEFANPVTRAAIPGLLLAYQDDGGLHERLVDRAERGVRMLLRGLLVNYLDELSPSELSARADAVFDLLVATTAIRGLTMGMADCEPFCERTADALTALAFSTWRPTP